jgi:hypothetical protein
VVFEGIEDAFTIIEKKRRYEIADTKKWRAKYDNKNDNAVYEIHVDASRRKQQASTSNSCDAAAFLQNIQRAQTAEHIRFNRTPRYIMKS